MTEEQELPRGGVTAKKYAALALALGMARGALLAAIEGDIEEARTILDLTAIAQIARALECDESDLGIDWNQYLSPEESNRITVGV